MDKIGVLSTGVTPCFRCGETSSTVEDGEYVCNSCRKKNTTKVATDNESEKEKSVRKVIEEIS
jgi:uncharacterized protein YcbX